MRIVPPDPEWTALEAGLKPAVRVAIRSADAPQLAAGLRARGASVLAAPRRVRLGPREPETVLYVARDEARAEQLRAAEQRTLDADERSAPDDRSEAHRELGRLLGYPACCVDSFVKVTSAFDDPGGAHRSVHEDMLHARSALLATQTSPMSRINPLLMTARIRLVTFYPCRYDCGPARDYADAVLAAMRRKDEAAALALDQALACTVALASSGARAIVSHGRSTPPPRPRGMLDERGDTKFSAWLDGELARGAAPGGVLTVTFAPPRS